MELQDWFYLVAIMFMLMSISLILLIAVIFYLFYKKIVDLHDLIETKINRLLVPAEIAVGVGSAVAKTAIKGVKKIIEKDSA